MHNRKDILENQKKFKEEISLWLKNDFKSLRKELNSIESEDKLIVDAKSNLESKFKKIKVQSEIDKLFISYKNVYPKFYAWWDENNQEVIKYKYKDL
jgi:hypothetical protein